MPSYQFNNFTGRLKESSHFQPLYPISAAPLQTSEPPKMIWDSVKTRPASVTNARSSSSGGSLPPKMLKTFEAYQKNLEAPVYLIRGTPDKILFGLTVAGTTVGLFFAFSYLFKSAFPKKV